MIRNTEIYCLFLNTEQVLKVFEESFDGNTPPLEVIQDLWHARMRVERKMNRARKRFSQAVYELQHIFSRFKKKKDAGKIHFCNKPCSSMIGS